MRRLTMVLGWALLIALTAAPVARADFGLQSFDLSFANSLGSTATQAGSHPFAVTTSLAFNTAIDPVYGEVPDGSVKDLELALPEGLVGKPDATPRCSSADFANIDPESRLPNCSNDAAIGVVTLRASLKPGDPPESIKAPVYNLVPPPGVVQELGFSAKGAPVRIRLTLNPEPPHNIEISISFLSGVLPVLGSTLTIWGRPADPAHDPERGGCVVPSYPAGPDGCPTEMPDVPFLTLPRGCSRSLAAGYEADSWSNPGVFVSGIVPVGDGAEPPRPLTMSGCDKLAFFPTASAQPTNGAAQSPTGLDFSLSFANEGLTSATGLAEADVGSAVVTLPAGIVVNPPAAAGLGVCTPADYRRETLGASPGVGCPGASKLGSAEADTPLLEEGLKGSVFLAQPDDPSTAAAGAENPFDSLLAIYIVLENPKLGVLVKQPAEIRPDPDTGRLVAVAGELPQIPFSKLKLHFHEGERALLATPPICGLYRAETRLVPAAEPGRALSTSNPFEVSKGVGGAPCPAADDQLPFRPIMRAGTLAAIAGTYRPFVVKVSRGDDTQAIRAIQARLPAGVAARIAGIPFCSDSQLAAAEGRSGGLEGRRPACPAASKVGTANVGAGAGALPLYLRGSVYLAGPYRGAPISLAIVVPALAGPFDLGTVVVRVALQVDADTAQVELRSDPTPTILAGIPLNLRSIALNLDRPGFMLNPTSCDASTIAGTATSIRGDSAPLSSRFQVGACGSLGFRPRLSLRLEGATHRSAHPRLRAQLVSRGGDANLKRIAITLPGTELLESRHIEGVCTGAQFEAGTCPGSSIYGYAQAWSPLLDGPLQGPVYLRAGKHRLPDLVASLDGQIHLDLHGRIDSVGGRIRNTFAALPDVPLSKFVLTMKGGRRGLLVNSKQLCGKPRRAGVALGAQNGMIHDTDPVVKVGCGGELAG